MSKEFDKGYGYEAIIFGLGDDEIKVATSKAKLGSYTNNILKNKELREISLVKEYLTTALDTKGYLISA